MLGCLSCVISQIMCYFLLKLAYKMCNFMLKVGTKMWVKVEKVGMKMCEKNLFDSILISFYIRLR